jgi:putative endonuclease
MTTRSPATHLELGAEGETRAARHLVRRGYRIVARNVRAGGVELDLVARRGRMIVFVEVKTRRSTRLGPPELSVDARKQARLVRGAVAWLAENPTFAQRIRFDVVACEVATDGSGVARWRIRHIPDAFEAGDDR